MTNLTNKTRLDGISIYHECIPKSLAREICEEYTNARSRGQCRDGVTGGGMDKSVKDTLDLIPYWDMNDSERLKNLVGEAERCVFDCIVDYYKDNRGMLYGLHGSFAKTNAFTYPRVENVMPHLVQFQRGQLQYYANKSNGYTSNHCEAMINEGYVCPSSYRVLTWMMTLNDLPVTKEQYGYTVFNNQNIAVRPQAGQLVLFSPWLDCEHRGNPTNGNDKTIITSWVTRRNL